jgi:hypothetical protein
MNNKNKYRGRAERIILARKYKLDRILADVREENNDKKGNI